MWNVAAKPPSSSITDHKQTKDTPDNDRDDGHSVSVAVKQSTTTNPSDLVPPRSIIAPFSIESPMPGMHRPSTNTNPSDGPSADPPSVARCNTIRHKIKGAIFFIVSTVAIGFLFIASQAVASSTGKSHEDYAVKVRWWAKVDEIEIIFYLFVLSAILHFNINAGGGSKIKYWSSSVPVILTISIILIGVAPVVYRQVKNGTKDIRVDRRGCESVVEVDTRFRMLDQCPLIQSNSFVRYDFNNHTEEETRVLTDGLGVLTGIGASNLLAISMEELDAPELRTYMSKTCVFKLFDVICADLFRECDIIDCTIPSNTCFKSATVARLQEWRVCAKQECKQTPTFQYKYPYDPNWCTKINDQQVIDKVLPTIKKQLVKAVEVKAIDQMTLDLMSATLDRFGVYLLEAGSSNLGQCPSAPNVQNSGATNTNTSITCDITKQTYTSKTVESTFNSIPMLSLVFAVFCGAVVVFGDYESIHFHLSAVRLGCFVVGLLMSILIYIGSLHLYWSSRNNPLPRDAHVQLTWRAFYLVISYMCLHGGLLVIVGSDASFVDEEQNTKEASSKSQDVTCSVCGRKQICCRNNSRGIKILYFFKAFKEQFWDASGMFFPLKLMIMEVVEIGIQINSLTSGATKSHVSNVVLSAIIIAANLILLPLVIVLPSKCFKSESAYVGVASVMVVEVLFDKLYVSVGVLLRYNTLTQQNMTVTDQLAVHVAMLLPALMTALDVQDALELAEHMEAMSAIESSDSNKRIRRSSTFRRVAGKLEEVTHSPVVLIIGKCGLVLSIVIGIVLATYTSIAATTAHANCEHRIGKIASCAVEQFYFTDGFFQQPRCAFEQVTSFNCNAGTRKCVL